MLVSSQGMNDTKDFLAKVRWNGKVMLNFGAGFMVSERIGPCPQYREANGGKLLVRNLTEFIELAKTGE